MLDSSRLSRYLSQEPTLAFNNPKEGKINSLILKELIKFLLL